MRGLVFKVNMKGKTIIWSSHPGKYPRKGQFGDHFSLSPTWPGFPWCWNSQRITTSFICVKPFFSSFFQLTIWLVMRTHID